MKDGSVAFEVCIAMIKRQSKEEGIYVNSNINTTKLKTTVVGIITSKLSHLPSFLK